MAMPAFKPSGRGLMKDLESIKISEMIAWGAHKSKLRKQMEEVAGITTIDGTEVYGNIDILGQTCTPDSPAMELLELYGVDEEGQMELCDAETENDLAEYKMLFRSALGERPEDWEAYIDALDGMLGIADEIQIVSTPISYTATGGAPKYSNNFGITNGTSDNVYAAYMYGTAAIADWVVGADMRTANAARLKNFFSAKILSGGSDITNQIDPLVRVAITCMILMEGSNAFASNSQMFTESNDGTWFNIDQIESFSANINNSYMKSRYDAYTLPNEGANENMDSTEPRVPGPRTAVYFPFYYASIWDSVRLSLGSQYFKDILDEETGGLFIPMGPYADVAMTVEGLRTSTYEDFGFWVSAFMMIHTFVDQGSKFNQIIVGIMRAFLTFVDALVGFFLKIPILKQMLEGIIGWIMSRFDLEYDSARGVLVQVIAAIIIIIIGFYLGPILGAAFSTATAGTTIAVSGLTIAVIGAMLNIASMASYAYQIYNTMRQSALSYGEAEDDREQEKLRLMRLRDPMNKVHEAFFGTLGSSTDQKRSDNLMYNLMFNPFDVLEQAPQQKVLGETTT
jgi:hypothetical protein